MGNFYLELKNFNMHHPVITPLIFISIYIFYTLLSLPGIFVLSILAGFLFNQPFSTFYVVVAATIGASLLFLLARTAIGQLWYKQPNQFFYRLKGEFRENAASYLLFLRLIPLFPFWIVNLTGALFGVRFWVFIWTTFLGMIPSVFIYTEAGKTLIFLLESYDTLEPSNLINYHLIIVLTGLAFLSLLPLLFNYLKSK